MFEWPVMHLCDRQLRDVNPDDILYNGLYRKCNIYKSGGGYDKFADIYLKRNPDCNVKGIQNQFVVQVRGCPLRCPYCYVTPEGIHTGKCTKVSSGKMVYHMHQVGLSVFHLMGGAPALYVNQWYDILNKMNPVEEIFHSDFVLAEPRYDKAVLKHLAQYQNILCAVSIKAYHDDEWLANTGVVPGIGHWQSNLDDLVESGLPIYFTFTGMDSNSVEEFKQDHIKRYGDPHLFDDSFTIDIVHYNALD